MGHLRIYPLCIVVALAFTSSYVAAENVTQATTTTTTETPQAACARQAGKSCEDCVSGHAKCYYCEKDKKCTYFDTLMPSSKECGSIGDMKWTTCKINYKFMIIGVSVTGGILLLGIAICCCCCCRKRKNFKWNRDQLKWERQREELQMRSDERKRERESRVDEIRRKYGLKNDNYKRFDA